MRLILVVNKDAWAIGTLARFLMLGAPEGWDVKIVTLWDAERRPKIFRREVSHSDIVHWMLHRTVLEPPVWNDSAVNICSVHHIEDYETSFEYLSRCQGVVVHAERYREFLVSKGIPSARIVCIPHPIDRSFLIVGEQMLRRSPRPRGSTLRIGFFSTAEYGVERKGIDLLPAVLRPLLSTGQRCEVLVTGFKWPELLAKPEFAGLPITLTMVPSYFDMPKLYASVDVYLCLSRIEGGPMPVFEAAACGIPVISTPVGRVPELLRPEYSYAEIPIGDPAAATAALRSCVEKPDVHREYARRAFESVSTTMAVSLYQGRQYDFYSTMSGKPWRAASTGNRTRFMRRRWRAADRLYWAKELWSRGNRPEAVRLAGQGLLLDPCCPAFWGAIVRRLIKPLPSRS